MLGTLQHPENCVGPKCAAETACPWAPSADPRIIYRCKRMKCSATTGMTRGSPGTQKGIPRLEPGAQGSSGARSRDTCWRLLLFRETEYDGPQAWPSRGQCPAGPAGAVTVFRPCSPRHGALPQNAGASHGNCHAKHGRAANPLDLFWTADLSRKYRSARTFCDQQPKEFGICPSLRYR